MIEKKNGYLNDSMNAIRTVEEKKDTMRYAARKEDAEIQLIVRFGSTLS
ncbi:Uncharacterised protein [uncultured archaeon]|nr:Uncharacterised protein [uncultured archaeon]